MDDLTQATLHAVDRLEQKHIAKYGHNRGFLKKISWRVQVKVFSRWHVLHGKLDVSSMSKLIDVSLLNDPYAYPRPIVDEMSSVTPEQWRYLES